MFSVQTLKSLSGIRRHFEKGMRNDIPVFRNINDLHEATGYDHRTHLPGFDIFDFETLDPSCAMCMPPYKQDFYQVAIATQARNSHINVNTNSVTLAEIPLWTVVPGQVFSWVRAKGLTGFQLYFKKEFLEGYQGNFLEDFPFFKMTENSVLYATQEEADRISREMMFMLAAYGEPHPYQAKRLEGMLMSLLYDYKSVYDRFKTTESALTSAQRLTSEFQQLVNGRYLDTKNVSDYAEELSVTPNYLTTAVKEVMGKTAKQVIEERLFTESKNLLSFTDMDIAQVAYTLNFQQPTHFTRFFKKLSGHTPNQYRAGLA